MWPCSSGGPDDQRRQPISLALHGSENSYPDAVSSLIGARMASSSLGYAGLR